MLKDPHVACMVDHLGQKVGYVFRHQRNVSGSGIVSLKQGQCSATEQDWMRAALGEAARWPHVGAEQDASQEGTWYPGYF